MAPYAADRKVSKLTCAIDKSACLSGDMGVGGPVLRGTRHRCCLLATAFSVTLARRLVRLFLEVIGRLDDFRKRIKNFCYVSTIGFAGR